MYPFHRIVISSSFFFPFLFTSSFCLSFASYFSFFSYSSPLTLSFSYFLSFLPFLSSCLLSFLTLPFLCPHSSFFSLSFPSSSSLLLASFIQQLCISLPSTHSLMSPFSLKDSCNSFPLNFSFPYYPDYVQDNPIPTTASTSISCFVGRNRKAINMTTLTNTNPYGEPAHTSYHNHSLPLNGNHINLPNENRLSLIKEP